MMLFAGVDPQQIQKHLRHALPQTTLAVYSHWLPPNERPANVISGNFGQAVKIRKGGSGAWSALSFTQHLPG